MPTVAEKIAEMNLKQQFDFLMSNKLFGEGIILPRQVDALQWLTENKDQLALALADYCSDKPSVNSALREMLRIMPRENLRGLDLKAVQEAEQALQGADQNG